jgi:hypothetical protein
MLGNIYASAVGVKRTASGRRLVVSRVVDAPAAAAWAVLTEVSQWPAWGPTVAAVDCPVRRIEAGTTGRIRVAGVGLWAPFEVDAYVDTEAEKRWTWRVARVPATGHRVDPLGDRCRVSFEVPLVAAGYVPVCRRALDNVASLATARDDG